MRRRLFQGLEKRVKTREREHMNFVNEIDLIAATRRHVLRVFQQISCVINPGAGGRVYLDQVDIAIFPHLCTN